jgi:site-specific DNA recombinase
MNATPRSAILLARLSDVREDDKRGIDGQVKDGIAHARRIGWSVGPELTHVIIENTESGNGLRGVSAFKRRKVTLPDGRTELRTVRPGFRRALAMLADGSADGLLAIDLDRAMRDPRDLEDLIDLIEQSSPRIPVESLTGSLRLANDADITMARVMVAVANKASRDTARRVAAARKHRAEAGKYGGGIRPFGFEYDGVTIRPAEAAEIVNAADAVLAGVPVRQIVADLRARNVPTVTGTTWKPTTVRQMLLRPRNAGLMIYRGEVVGDAPWPAILPKPVVDAVKAVLEDPSRRTAAGNTPRWLGSGLYLCGVCRQTLAVRGTARGRRGAGYRCELSHVTRAADRLDEYVGAVICAWLERPDSVGLLTPRIVEPDMLGLRREAASLRELLNEQARLHARGVIDGQQLAAGSEELRAKLRVAEQRLSAVVRRDPLDGIAGNADAGKVWDGLDLGRKRAVLAALCTVTLLPATHGRLPGGGYLDTSAVQFDWNQ